MHLMVIWYANQHSGLLAVLGLCFSIIVGLALYALLKKRARKRLDPQDGE